MKIRHKINALTGIIIAALVVTMVISNYVGQSQTLHSVSNTQLSAYNDIFWEQVNADSVSLEKLLSVLTKNNDLINTFLSGDREQLLGLAKPIFDDIKSKYLITHFYFIDTQGKVFLRVHNPPKHGDVLKRATYLQAKNNGTLGKGIEMGKSFFSLRVVMPVYRDNQVVGYFELGEELEHLIESFTNVAKADISMWVSNTYATQKNLTNVFQKVGNWYRVMASNNEQQSAIMATANQMLENTNTISFSYQFSDKQLAVQTYPFNDAFGDQAGIILIANDISNQIERLHSFIAKITGMAIIILIAAFFITSLVSRGITQPLHQANDMLEDISRGAGDLTKRLTIDHNDEVGDLATNFNLFVDKLQTTINKVASTATQVTTASEELSMSTHAATEIVNRQRFETEQVATAINEMTATVHEVAHSANDAANAADKADQESEAGKAVVMQTIEAISELAREVENSADVIAKLKSESQNIGSVLDVIKGIAEQTNLLALNAAIEAARAGEQGRGFAVVADEVRTLAQRTQESTREIEQMIEALQKGSCHAEEVMSQSRGRAQQTVETASSAGDSLHAITRSVATIKDMNTQIAAAAEEQSSVAEEINKNISNIQSISEETASGSNQTKSACNELAGWGAELQQIVSQFKT